MKAKEEARFTQCAVLQTPVQDHRGQWYEDVVGVHHWFFMATTEDQSLWFVAQFAQPDDGNLEKVREVEEEIKGLRVLPRAREDASSSFDGRDRHAAHRSFIQEQQHMLNARKNELTAASCTVTTSHKEAVCWASSVPQQVTIAKESGAQGSFSARDGRPYSWVSMPPKSLDQMEAIFDINPHGKRPYHSALNNCQHFAEWMYETSQRR